MTKQFLCTGCGEVSVIRTVPPVCPACGGGTGVIQPRQGEIKAMPLTQRAPEWPSGVAVV